MDLGRIVIPNCFHTSFLQFCKILPNLFSEGIMTGRYHHGGRTIMKIGKKGRYERIQSVSGLLKY